MPDEASLLIVAENAAARDRIATALPAANFVIQSAPDCVSALEIVSRQPPDVIIAEIGASAINGKVLIDSLNGLEEPIPVVLIAPNGDACSPQEIPAGAYDYLPECFGPEQLRVTVRHALERQSLLRENRAYYKDVAGILAKLKLSQTALVQAEKIGSLGRLVAGIAHEVNSPLGVLQSGVDTIERAAQKIAEWKIANPGEAMAGIDSILEIVATTVAQSKAACDRIDALVTNLRQFAQLDRADYQRTSIHEGIESVIAVMKRSDGIEIVKEFGEVPDIDCSPRQLNQLFMHLLLNASEAIRQGGGRGTIRIRTRCENRWVKVEIRDTGIGIPQQHLDKIFDPGFTTKGVQVGTGLGLPVCFQIAQAHQGRIDVESSAGKGACFTVSLPAERYL